MSEYRVGFYYESLDVFRSKNLVFPNLMQIIPFFCVRNTREIFAMLTLNNQGILSDFSETYNGENLENYVSNSLRYNSLNIIQLNKEFINNNSFISYELILDEDTGLVVFNKNILPIIFVQIEIDNISILNDILLSFRIEFKSVLSKNIKTVTDVTNLTYLSAEELFYVCRFTTYKIDDEDGNIFEVNLEDQGFPVRNIITEIYKTNPVLGEIPVSINYNQYSNSCPNLEFYRSRSLYLANSILAFFEAELPIIEFNFSK